MNLKKILEEKVLKGHICSIVNNKKNVINTINAHSFCVAKDDKEFMESLVKSDVLLPDGVSIVLAGKVFRIPGIKKIAGADAHQYLLEQANLNGQKVFYLGSTSETLKLIEAKVKSNYPNIQVHSYSPPFKSVFDPDDSQAMINAVNSFQPKYLFVGMTAPKQEKWVQENKNEIKVSIIANIGAVFDFYAGTVKRAPSWMINLGMEWLFRLISEPRRLWRRYLINNIKFCWYLLEERLG